MIDFKIIKFLVIIYSKNVPFTSSEVARNHLSRFASDVIVLVSTKDFNALHDLCLVLRWATVTHVVKDLISDLRVVIR